MFYMGVLDLLDSETSKSFVFFVSLRSQREIRYAYAAFLLEG